MKNKTKITNTEKENLELAAMVYSESYINETIDSLQEGINILSSGLNARRINLCSELFENVLSSIGDVDVDCKGTVDMMINGFSNTCDIAFNFDNITITADYDDIDDDDKMLLFVKRNRYDSNAVDRYRHDFDGCSYIGFPFSEIDSFSMSIQPYDDNDDQNRCDYTDPEEILKVIGEKRTDCMYSFEIKTKTPNHCDFFVVHIHF